MAKQVTLYTWPKCQICMECDHGRNVDVEDTDEPVPTMICLEAVEMDGVNCPSNTYEDDETETASEDQE